MKSKDPVFILFLILLLSLSLGISLISGLGTYPSVDPNMVLYYHFNNDSSVGENYGIGNVTYDYSGNGNNGTVLNNVPYLPSGGNLTDGAFNFSVVSNLINVSNFVSQLNGIQNFTISVWLYRTSSNSQNSVILQKGTGSIYLHLMKDFSYVPELYLNGTSNASSVGIPANKWVHLAIVHSGNNLLYYQNGNNTDNKTLIKFVGIDANSLSIGNKQDGSRNYNGSMDELIIYNRSLSANEIKNIYDISSGMECGTLPFEGCFVTHTTTFTKGNYSINGSTVNLAGIMINADNIILDGAGSTLVGNNLNNTIALQIFNHKNITIKNFTFYNYHYPFKTNNVSSIFIDTFKIYNSIDGILSWNYFNDSRLTNFTFINVTRILDMDNMMSLVNGLNNLTLDTFSIDKCYGRTDISPLLNIGLIRSGNKLVLNHFFINNSDSFLFYNQTNLQLLNSNFNNLNYTNTFYYNNNFSVNNLTITNSPGCLSLNNDDNGTHINHFYQYNDTAASCILFRGGAVNSLVENSVFNKSDIPIYINNLIFSITTANQNITMLNNTFLDLSTDFDGYGHAFMVQNNAQHIYFLNNTVNGYDSCGVLIWGGQNGSTSDIQIKYNSFKPNSYNYLLSLLPNYNHRNGLVDRYVYTYNRFNTAICMPEIYASWTGDSSEEAGDNLTNKIYKYAVNNITISGNVFNESNNVYLWMQGSTNVTHDLNSSTYWYRSYQAPTWLVDKTEIYINNLFNNLSVIPYRDSSEGHIEYSYFEAYRAIKYINITQDKNYQYFKNINTTISQGVNLFNLSSPLITFSNGTSLYQSGTNLEYNFTLNPNAYLYVYEDLGDLELRRCNATNNFTFINFTFMDEKNNSIKLNGTISQASFTYFADGYPINVSKNYNFTSSEINETFPICITPTDKNYWINYTLVYNGEGGYSERTQSTNYILFTNTTTKKELSLLNSSNVVTFQVINSLSQAINGAYVYVLPYLNDSILSSGYTDSGGIIQFLLSNGTTYRIYFEKSGYDTYSTLLNPTESFYTITLSGTGLVIVTPPDYSSGDSTIPESKGVTYTTKPQNTWLNNGTYYSFNLTIDSGTWTLTNWGFNITDQDSNLINATSSTIGSGGTLNINASTSNYTRVIMNFYYTVNGTKIDLQRVWLILDTSDNTYSINNFINDSTDYIGSGLFGLTSFGLSFIVFFIIFIGAGMLSYRYGLTSPVAICGFIFAVIWFFDVSLGWIPTPINAIPHIATWLIAFIFCGFIIKEVANG